MLRSLSRKARESIASFLARFPTSSPASPSSSGPTHEKLVQAIEDIPPTDWAAEFRALTKTPEEMARMIRPERNCIRGRTPVDEELAREHFGKRKPGTTKRPRLGPPPAFMPEGYHRQHMERRAQNEDWRELAWNDNREWVRRCNELEERVQLLDSKRQDLEAQLAQEIRTSEDALEVGLRAATVAEKFQARAKEWEERAETMRDAIAFTLSHAHVGGLAWLAVWNEGDEVSDEELQQWRASRGGNRTGAPGGQPGLQGEAIFGRDGLRPLSDAVGRERPGAAPVQPGTGPVASGVDQARQDTPSENVASLDDADMSKHARCIMCFNSDQCMFPSDCIHDNAKG